MKLFLSAVFASVLLYVPAPIVFADDATTIPGSWIVFKSFDGGLGMGTQYDVFEEKTELGLLGNLRAIEVGFGFFNFVGVGTTLYEYFSVVTGLTWGSADDGGEENGSLVSQGSTYENPSSFLPINLYIMLLKRSKELSEGNTRYRIWNPLLMIEASGSAWGPSGDYLRVGLNYEFGAMLIKMSSAYTPATWGVKAGLIFHRPNDIEIRDINGFFEDTKVLDGRIEFYLYGTASWGMTLPLK